MLLISASLKPSALHGIGCFTDERIAAGQIVWVFDERIDVQIPALEATSLPVVIQTFLSVYGYTYLYGEEKFIVLCGDHSRHMNHSLYPNLLEGGKYKECNIAARDIEAGEELTCNYFDFDLDAPAKFA